MNILQAHQYNQGIGKYKLLSSTAGVGSIITTKFGTYVLISDINNWQFVNVFNNRIKSLLESPPKDVYDGIKREAENLGLSLVDDKRFVQFIQNEKKLDKLECLVAIPQMALNEVFNSVNWTNKVHGKVKASHPIAMALNDKTLNLLPNMCRFTFSDFLTYHPGIDKSILDIMRPFINNDVII